MTERTIFQKGDIVRGFYEKGIVIDDRCLGPYPILVEWECWDCSLCRRTTFTIDGKCIEEHTCPILTLIERPEKKKTIELWINIYDGGGRFYSSNPQTSEKEANYINEHRPDREIRKRLACLKITFEINDN